MVEFCVFATVTKSHEVTQIIPNNTIILLKSKACRAKSYSSHIFHFSTCALSCQLSVAACVSFFVAWSPYAVVSMWAAFGYVENIPPVAFAVPAMFAKSSTIYNPIIYLMLRPNFRRVMWRDLGVLCHTCLRGCHCTKDPEKCCSKPEIRIRLGTIQTKQVPSPNSCAQPPMIALNDHSCGRCKDAFECFRHYPQMCGVTNPDARRDSCKYQDFPVPQTRTQKTRNEPQKPMLAIMYTKRISEIDNVHINLELTPGHAKLAWPWYCSEWLSWDLFCKLCSSKCAVT